MSKGNVAKVNEDKGFGFIRSSSDGQSYFFHNSDVIGDVRFADLNVGDVVEFVATPGSGKGPRAADVRVVSADE